MQHSDSPLLCYANADMILMSDLVRGSPAGLGTGEGFFAGRPALEPGSDRTIRFQRRLGITLAQAMLPRDGEFYSHPGASTILSFRAIFIPRCQISPSGVRPGITGWFTTPAPPLGWQSMPPGMCWLFTRTMITATCRATSHLMVQRWPNPTWQKPGGRKCIFNILDTNRELGPGTRPQTRESGWCVSCDDWKGCSSTITAKAGAGKYPCDSNRCSDHWQSNQGDKYARWSKPCPVC